MNRSNRFEEIAIAFSSFLVFLQIEITIDQFNLPAAYLFTNPEY